MLIFDMIFNSFRPNFLSFVRIILRVLFVAHMSKISPFWLNSNKKVNLTNFYFDPIYGIAGIKRYGILRLELILYKGKSETNNYNWEVLFMHYNGQLNEKWYLLHIILDIFNPLLHWSLTVPRRYP